ncbi:hypothetical protein HK096_010548, partial [Nowakowskiella sp. JEL0078]
MKSVIYATGLAVISTALIFGIRQKLIDQKFYFQTVPSLPFIGSWRFFNKRLDFLRECTKIYGPFFRFNIMGYQVFNLSGPEARQFFFAGAGDRHEVNMSEGVAIFVATPRKANVKVNDSIKKTLLIRRLTYLLSNQRIERHLLNWSKDINEQMSQWDNIIDPFKNIYDLVFLITSRTIFANELANDKSIRTKFSDLFSDLERSTSFVSNLIPYLPSSNRKLRNDAVTGMYMILNDVISARTAAKAEGLSCPDDSLQYLIDSGDSVSEIMAFITGGLFAGVITTGIQVPWAIIHLSKNRKWIPLILAELESAVKAHTNGDIDKTKPLDLSVLTMDDWEKQLPTLTACVIETNRLITADGVSMRRVMTPGIVFKGFEFPVGSFLIYQMGDTHNNDELYENPKLYNPLNFLNKLDTPVTDSRKPFDYIGFGAGRHPCTGMRMAKLELRMVTASFLNRFPEFELVGGVIPEIDINDLNKIGVPSAP